MDFKKQAEAIVAKMTLEEKMSQMHFQSPAIPRLGIPAYNWWNESLHGVARNGTATVFPQAIGLAASFNKELMQRVGEATSDEARAKYNENKKQGFTDIYQGLSMCSPNINLFRDPRWGRGQETYGEDPVLTAMMATAYIKGLQGDGVYRKAGATLKHYAVHSGPEGLRRGFNVDVTDEELFDTYLYAFGYCIRHADPSAVMPAYNAVNGEPCVASKRLLQDILREKFGFKGLVVSDSSSVEFLHEFHNATNSSAESAAVSVKSGCDVCIGFAYQSLPEALEKGMVDEAAINDAVIRLFEERCRLGMFAEKDPFEDIPYEVIECQEHKDLNLEMARQSIVLLKNDGILPLKKQTRVAVIGPCADDMLTLLGNYNGRPSEYYTFLRGIKEKTDHVLFAMGTEYKKEPKYFEEHMNNEALIAARKSDVVIMCMGLNPLLEGEQLDGGPEDAEDDKSSIMLPAVQRELYEKIIALGKPVIFVNVSGSCLVLADQDRDCNAVLQCFYPGAMGGRALADILFGDVSPSGRLPVTFYRSDEDLPDFADYKMENRTYRFFNGTPVYRFGHGLSYSEIKEEWTANDRVVLTNCGDYDTHYAVLRYEDASKRRLIDFKKVFIRKAEQLVVQFPEADI